MTTKQIKNFFSKVEKTDACWLWTGNKISKDKPYGRFWTGYPNGIMAHRFSYMLHKGLIPEGKFIDHLCRNKPCVNPEHLEVVTNRENVLRGILPNLEKTHCKRGHEFTEVNTYRSHNKRHCRVCRRDRAAQIYKESIK